MNPDDLIVFDADPIQHVADVRLLFERLREHNLKPSPFKSRVRTKANKSGQTISPAGAGLAPERLKPSPNAATGQREGPAFFAGWAFVLL